MSNQVTGLPPTISIKDPDVRAYLDALGNAWDHRSGTTDPSSGQRFITADEFKTLAGDAVVSTLASAISGGNSSNPVGNGAGGVGGIISAISDEIKRSLLYQLLGTQFETIDVGGLSASLDAAFQNANTLFMQEQKARSSADEAIVTSVTAQGVRLGHAEAAITTESETRVNKDTALASAINNIWATIGGSSAVIQDGALAQVNPSGAYAQKWTQVQSEVIDPNTGLSKVASIRQDFSTFADKVSNKFGSLYSVRAEITQDGRTIVGGFGLSATSGVDGQGPTIDFGVRADRFWVGNLSGVGDIPFIIQTEPTTVKGVTRPAGVYMKDAFIGYGAIGRAQIGRAEIDTLRIGGNAVTIPSYGSGVIFTDVTEGYWSSDIAVAYITIDGLDSGEVARTIAMATLQAYPNDGTTTNLLLGIFVNDVLNTEFASTFSSNGISMSGTGSWLGGNGTYKVSIKASCSSFRASGFKAANALVGGIVAMTGKR